MHLDSSILTLITFLPTAGALVLLLLPRQGRAIQWGALLTALATFVVSLHLVAHYVVGQAGFQFEQNVSWIPTPAIRYHVGVDGLSLWLVLLTTFLAPLGVLVSWRAIETRTK
jgi:NADH-quinone oxidoreductase subunit M